jgi:hypothetical protein
LPEKLLRMARRQRGTEGAWRNAVNSRANSS